MSLVTCFTFLFLCGIAFGCFVPGMFTPWRKSCERSKPPPPKPCVATCANPYPTDCDNPVNDCGCGKIRSCEGGECIPICDCPRDGSCYGDRYSIIQAYPPKCRPSCENPNPCQKTCKVEQLPYDCVCKSGYIYSEYLKRCVEDCPKYCG